MLYDNALLTVTYLEAYQAIQEPFYREIAEETLAYVEREMTREDGPFFSTQDADSEGVEGKFFVWSKEEVERILGDDGARFCEVYDVTSHGNWKRRTSSTAGERSKHMRSYSGFCGRTQAASGIWSKETAGGTRSADLAGAR